MSVNLLLAKPGDWFLAADGYLMVLRHIKLKTSFPFVLYNPVLKHHTSYTQYGTYWINCPCKQDLQCKVRLKPGTVLYDQFTHNLETIPCPLQPNT